MFAVVAGLLLVAVSAEAQQKCCLPKETTMMLTDLGTVNGKTFIQVFMEIDFNRMQQAMVNITYDPSTGKSTMNSRTVQDFQKKVLYYVPGNDTSKCYKIPNTQNPLECVPDNAHYLGSSYLGPMAGGLEYDGWRFPMDDTNALIVTIAMTKKGCIPIVEGINFPANPENNKLFLMTNFEPKLQDPSAFDLPPSCNQQ